MNPVIDRLAGAVLHHIVIPAIKATINAIKTIVNFEWNTANLEWQGIQWIGNMDVQVLNSGLHSKDRNVRAFVECSVTARCL